MEKGADLNEGPETVELAKIIPIENLKVYLSLFYSVKEFLNNFDRKDLENYSPGKVGAQVYRIKKKFHGIMDSDQLTSVVSSFVEKNVEKMFFYRVLKRVGRPGDRARGLLVNILVYDCVKHSDFKKHALHALIARFLEEQGLVHEGFDGDSVRKICRTMKLRDADMLCLAYLVLTPDRASFPNVVGIHQGFLSDFLAAHIE